MPNPRSPSPSPTSSAIVSPAAPRYVAYTSEAALLAFVLNLATKTFGFWFGGELAPARAGWKNPVVGRSFENADPVMYALGGLAESSATSRPLSATPGIGVPSSTCEYCSRFNMPMLDALPPKQVEYGMTTGSIYNARLRS